MIDPERAEALIQRVQDCTLSGVELRDFAMKRLAELPGYDWSGIYRLEGDTLVLDAYVGAATDHDRIPVGRGVCGTAVAEDTNQLVDDVRTLDNYLSCSLETRSEIVVLIRDNERTIGQIDIDGHAVAAFDQSDERMLSRLGEILAARW